MSLPFIAVRISIPSSLISWTQSEHYRPPQPLRVISFQKSKFYGVRRDFNPKPPIGPYSKYKYIYFFEQIMHLLIGSRTFTATYPNGKELVLKTSDGREVTAGSSPAVVATMSP